FVADPAFDRRRFPALRALDGAQAAAARFAASYARAVVLGGRLADRATVLAALGGSEVVHFETHGYSAWDAPESAGVVLAPSSAEPDGLLTGKDIARMRWPGLRLAVLAGCNTGPQTYEGSRQLVGVATALLGAGAADVITTSWEIDNAAAIRLFTTFHRCYSRGEASDTCLRTAQLALLRSGDPALA